MTRRSIHKACRLALGVLAGVAAAAQLRAEEIGVARVSDRPRAVVRAQSPDAPPAAPAAANPPSASPAAPQVTAGGPVYGLHYSVSCPEHGGVYDKDCPKCRYFAGYGDGAWTVDAAGNPVWCGDGSRESCGDRMCRKSHACGESLFGWLSDHEACFGSGPGQPLMGHYRIVYPVNPWYFDGRDAQVYAAQGYGGPVSVPLAPIVRQQYNYGWGIPSSRITPISRPLPLGVLHP